MESLQDMWQAVCDYSVKYLNVNDGALKLWFEPISIKSFDGQNVVLSVNNNFLYEYIVKLYKDLINKAFNNVIGFDVNVEIILEENEDKEFKEVNGDNGPSERVMGDSFENFVVGKSNNYAYAAAKSVAENPGKSYNPLFIYGKSGLGKTHLLKAIENEMRRRNPQANIIYTTCENFTNDLVYHIRTKNTYEFHNKYRNADALMVDDIQFIAGKESFEEEFFHTFNAIHEYGKQIVLTSDRPPNELQIFQERLKQRFEWGLMADIQPPDFETRVVILMNKADQYEIKISNEVVEFLASELKNNVRQLESAVKKIKAICSLTNSEPTLDVAKEAIKELTNYSQAIAVINSEIIDNVSNAFGISADNIMSDKRDKQIKDARQTAMYIMREITGVTLEEIGTYFGGKTHSTVKHSITNVASRMENDLPYKKLIEDIIKNVQDF